jgi:hypothetical protein
MPKNTRKFELDTAVADPVDIPCVKCRHATKHRVLASADLSGEDWYGDNSVQYSVNHQICQCQGCETITFRIISSNSEDYVQDDEGDYIYVESVDLYPSRNEGRSELKDSHLLPSNVRRIYDETYKAMNNDQAVLAGIGIRALIETVCRDRKAIGPHLSAKIDSLVKLGVLTEDGAKILHKIRTLGNNAAHEVKPHTSEQLGLALDVVEHLLQGVYVLPHYAKKTFK